jgi:hypothetical protein
MAYKRASSNAALFCCAGAGKTNFYDFLEISMKIALKRLTWFLESGIL